MKKTRLRGQQVAPLSQREIRAAAIGARKLFNLQEPYIDVIHLYEVELHRRNITFNYVTAESLPRVEAKTLPNEGIILVREEIYERALDGDGRARFTFCHELGHLMLHQSQSLELARSNTAEQWEFYEDSEWQADVFSAEFLMPPPMVAQYCRNTEDIMEVFGVTRTAATIRHNQLHKERIISW